MLYITEIPHRGLPRSWEAKNKDDFVLKLCAAYPRSGEICSGMTFDDAVAWMRANLRDLRIDCIDPDRIFEPSANDAYLICILSGAEYVPVPNLPAYETLEFAENIGNELSRRHSGRTYYIFNSVSESRRGKVFARPIVTCRATYPAGLTGESAYYACDGPDIQRIEELQRIIKLCDHWETPEAQALADEARSYLAEYE
jgi:hypothetical protein